jgi:hypothetical protein
MAKVNNNIFVRGLSGSLSDQFVIRKGRGGETIVSNMPSTSEGRQHNHAPLRCRRIRFFQGASEHMLFFCDVYR